MDIAEMERTKKKKKSFLVLQRYDVLIATTMRKCVETSIQAVDARETLPLLH